MGRGALAMGVVVVGLLAAAPGASAATLSYGFDGGTNQGWMVANNFDQPKGPAIANPVGGSPGGHLFYNDNAADPGALVSFFSPILPAGSLTANYGGTFSFDFRIQGGTPDRPLNPRLISAQGELMRFNAVAATNSFQRVSAALSPSGWNFCPPGGGSCGVATEAQMRAVLSAATQVELQVDASDGTGEDYSIDNVSLTDPPPVATPDPVTPATPAKKCKKKKKGKKGAEASKKNRKKCKRKKKK